MKAFNLETWLFLHDEDALKTEINTLQKENEAITRNMNQLESMVELPQHNEVIAILKQKNNEFNDYKDEIVSNISTGNREEALALINENSADFHEEFFEIISNMTSIFESNMDSSLQALLKDFQKDLILIGIILTVGIIFIFSLLYRIISKLTSRLNSMSTVMSDVARGNTDLSTKVEVISSDEIDEVAQSFNLMADSLEVQMKKEKELTWTKTNIADITMNLSGTHDLETLGKTFLSKIVPLVESSHAVFYVKDPDSKNSETTYKLVSSYAFKVRKHMTNTIRLGEGLIGQAVLEKSPIILYRCTIRLYSCFVWVRRSPAIKFICTYLFCFEDDVKAVLEIASFKPYSETQQNFLEELINRSWNYS